MPLKFQRFRILIILTLSFGLLAGCSKSRMVGNNLAEKEISPSASLPPSVSPTQEKTVLFPSPPPAEEILPTITPYPNREGEPVSFRHEETNAAFENDTSGVYYILRKGTTVRERFSLPEGYRRTHTAEGTFAHYLQNMPLLPDGAPLVTFDGKVRNDNHHAAVLDMDIGQFDLQQCADAVLRFRCEYLYSQARYDEICFHVSATTEIPFVKWANGYSLKEDENGGLYWREDAENDASPLSFRHYLNRLFTYAGTASLYDDTKKVSLNDLEIGDIFVVTETAENAGHSVIIVDMAQNNEDEKICLIAEGHTPAQSIHITKNLGNENLGPWYKLDDNQALVLKTATFSLDNARRFR